MEYKEYLENRRPYQEYGHIFLLERKHACLYYKPGKGKTYPCIDALRDVDTELKHKAKVLILSTTDAIEHMWESEIVPQNILPANVVLMSFRSAIVDETRRRLLAIKWDVIIIDECHKIKAHNTQISKLVYLLSKNAKYVWGLSGTPRGNSDVDIYCQFHNMAIGMWGDINYTAFVERCCDVETSFFHGHTIKKPIGISFRYKAGFEKNIAMYTQRVDYDEEDKMPPLNINEVHLNYERTQEYKNAMEGFIQIPNYATTMTKLAAISKLHQIANGFMYITDEQNEEIRKIYDISQYKTLNNKKLEWLRSHVHNKSWTIVYKFEADLIAIKTQLVAMDCTFTEDVEQFKKGNANILLLQCSRCESFNLQICDRITFYTLDYSYIMYNQMLHRAWRMGQTKPVTVDVLIYDGSIETKIWNAVKQKEELAELFMHIKES